MISPPAVANGVVYVGLVAPGRLSGYDAASGVLLWSGATGGYVYSGPAVFDGVVYVGAEDGKLYAFNLRGVPPGLNGGVMINDGSRDRSGRVLIITLSVMVVIS